MLPTFFQVYGHLFKSLKSLRNQMSAIFALLTINVFNIIIEIVR
jgi:hypothetical protein